MQYTRILHSWTDCLWVFETVGLSQANWTSKATNCQTAGSAQNLLPPLSPWTVSEPVTNEPSRKPRQSDHESYILVDCVSSDVLSIYSTQPRTRVRISNYTTSTVDFSDISDDEVHADIEQVTE